MIEPTIPVHITEHFGQIAAENKRLREVAEYGVTDPGRDPSSYVPTVHFVSAETLLNALDGYAVAAEGPDGPMEGLLHRFKPELQPEGIYMASFHDITTDELLSATDVRNLTRLTVL